jgi:lysozyme family protein
VSGLTVDQILDEVLEREGAYVNHPADRGGPTKFGVTLATLEGWRHADLSARDVEELTEQEARQILRQRYVVGPGLNQIRDERVRALVVDMAVNHGVRGAALIIQRALRLPGDGVIGPMTINALNGDGIAAGDVFAKVLAGRIRAYGRIISRDASQAVFAAGWLNRVAGFLDG